MTEAMLRVAVTALIMFGGLSPCFAVSLGNFPYISLAGNSDQPALTENVSVDNEEEFDFSQPLTLEDCIEIALKTSTEIRTAKFDLAREEINVKNAQSSYLPQISTNGRYQFSDTADFGWEKENYDASIGAKYVIWDHGQRRGTLIQAKLKREAEYSYYDGVRQSLIFNIIKAYYSLLEAEKLIDVDEQLLEQSRQNVEKIKAFVDAGIAIESDIATAKVQQASGELVVIRDRNNLDLARADLIVLMGLEPTLPFTVVDAPGYEKYMQTAVIETEELSIEDAVSYALAHRSEIEQSKTNLAISEIALTLATLERLPKIRAECGYNVRLDDYIRERNALKNHKSWDMSAGVSYSIFDGGRSRRIVQRAEIAMQRGKESLSQLEQSIALEVYQTYLSLERAKKSLDIASVQIEDAKMSLDVSQGRYEQQMIILLELLDAQTSYARALTNQVKAFYDYKVVKGTLERVMGVLK